MTTSSEEQRLKIAVFIDFDNIAIGVKQSLGRNFDVGTVLEAIKEKGQVISKIAYGDWKRAEDFSRAMTQHAVQMVQRNLTPGGDKNGADIALALDALEMAFTRNHINAFVIVGGDSDFMALVEKLKQYDKTVFVVGGRAFTSVILQKNCHEFISYENLIGAQSGGARRTAGKAPIASPASLENALPLIRRALKVLSDREVSPQLGLLKSTLLQLDSTFSERDYGVTSFRDFIQKVADAGYVNLKQVDRSLMVELKESDKEPEDDGVAERVEPPQPSELSAETISEPALGGQAQPQTPQAQAQPQAQTQGTDATRALEELLRDSRVRPHWPMYLRTFKQFLRSLQPPFDERQFGISSTYDLVRQAHRDGLVRVERNRQGILRIYPAERFPRAGSEPMDLEIPATVEADPVEQDVEMTAPPLESLSAAEPEAGRLEFPGSSETTSEAEFMAPETEPEEAHSEIIEEVIHEARVDTEDTPAATPEAQQEQEEEQPEKPKRRRRTAAPRTSSPRTRRTRTPREKAGARTDDPAKS